MTNPPKEPSDPQGLLKQFRLREEPVPPVVVDAPPLTLVFGTTPAGKFYVGYEADPPNLDLNVSVEGPTRFKITLRNPADLNQWVWKWSTDYRAITRKNDPDDRDYYKSLRYHPRNPMHDPRPWRPGMTAAFSTVSFIAYKGNHDPESHGFSMNIDFKVPNSDRWLPVTIDPEIINPKDPPLINTNVKLASVGEGSPDVIMLSAGGDLILADE